MRDYYKQLYANKLDNLEETVKFLDNLPKLSGEKTENLNKSATSEEIKSVIKNLPKNKVQAQMASLVNSIKHSKN